MTMPPAFPFTALVGQDALQQALLLVAVDPGIGGLLISGPRGTAKSTSARALAAVLPAHRFINLPLGASEAQLTGSLDIERMLRDGEVHFSPGLLAKAHGGVLYVDEVNLLPDTLIDPLLDVASSGVNVIERDGVSHSHPARFVLIGTMNPEEGELRPQLSDRFGLAVSLENCRDVLMRERIVKTRLAFDLDPAGFCAQYKDAEDTLAERVVTARGRIAGLTFSDAVHRMVSQRCLDAGVDGLRADLVMLKTARALAALEAASEINVGHVARVAEWVLLHRRTVGQPEATAQSGGPATSLDPKRAGDGGLEGAADRGSDGAAESAAERAANGAANEAANAVTDRAADGAPNRADDTSSEAGNRDTLAHNAGTDNVNNANNGTARDSAGARSIVAPHADWGYLAPEPVATLAAKKLRPFPAKKA